MNWQAIGLGAGLAILWPFLVQDPGWHDAGTALVAVAMTGLSLTVTAGWLRVPTLHQPAAVALGGYVAGLALSAGVPFVVALVAAIAAGAAVGVAAVLPVLRRPAPLLVATSLAAAAGVWVLAERVLLVAPFPRPTVFGVSLHGERPLYLTALVVLVVAYAGLERVRRSHLGRTLVAVGAGGDLAARVGLRTAPVWCSGLALSGALAGAAGWIWVLLLQGLPPAGALSPVAAAGLLAIPYAGGAAWPAGALIGALLVAGPGTLLGVRADAQAAISAAALAPVVLLLRAWPHGLAGVWAVRNAARISAGYRGGR